ncbi:MAG TPA: response regulator transcription factor [Terriglobia bacterium]|nr:response regulator transcription factor [Terriglobia bacterium]
MKPLLRVLLADDHVLVRAGIHSLLNQLEGIDVVGEASNGREALELVEIHRPGIVLMDIDMPELNGLEATARIVSRFPSVRVIILSVHGTEEHVLQALRAGAAGYLLKNISPAELDQAIRSVNEGNNHITDSVTKHVVARLVEGAKVGSPDRLTLRQREVLQLVAEGNTSKEIATKLGISVKTAESHRAEIMQTLGIHDTAGLVRYAIRLGIVSPDQ